MVLHTIEMTTTSVIFVITADADALQSFVVEEIASEIAASVI